MHGKMQYSNLNCFLFHIRRTKFADDKWLYQNGLKDAEGPFPKWWDLPMSSLPASTLVTVSSETTCSEAVRKMKQEGLTVIPVLNEDGCVGDNGTCTI